MIELIPYKDKSQLDIYKRNFNPPKGYNGYILMVGADITYLIANKVDNKVVSCLGIKVVDDTAIYLHVVTEKEYEGKGYASEIFKSAPKILKEIGIKHIQAINRRWVSSKFSPEEFAKQGFSVDYNNDTYIYRMDI